MEELTWKKVLDAWNTIRPPLYYATSDVVEHGQVMLCKAPKFIMCHPDDLSDLRRQIPHRRFVHLRDRPPDRDLLYTSGPLRRGDSS